MLIAALEFVTQVKGNSSKNSVRSCLPRNQSGQWYLVKHIGDHRSLDQSLDSETFVLYFKPYAALRRLSI